VIVVEPDTITSFTLTFRDGSGTKVAVATPTAKIYDFSGVEVGFTTSGFTTVSTGVYTYELSTSGITNTGSYRLISYGISGSQRLYADGPIVFEISSLSNQFAYVGPEELIHYLELEDPVDIVYIRELCRVATNIIHSYTRRVFYHKTITDEHHIVKNSSFVQLLEYPVISISSITFNGAVQTLANLTINYRTGQIDFGSDIYGEVYITYAAGFDSIPDQINLAAKKIAAWYYQRRKREGVRSERLLGYSYNLEQDVFADVREILDQHKNIFL